MTGTNRKKVILQVNRSKEQAMTVAGELRDWLSDRVEIVADNLREERSPATFPEADFIVIVGGDGTILSTVRQLGAKQIPVIGLNMGKLGFLAEFNAEQLREQFSRILSDSELISRRVIIECRVSGPGRADFSCLAVNEVAVVAGPPFRMIEVSVRMGEEHLALCSGDGLIISTPTGSTAYNLSAGGPILASSLEAAVITPLAAHSLGFRPIVVPLDRPIRIQPYSGGAERSRSGQYHIMVAVDGQEHTLLNEDDEVTLVKSPSQFLLVRNPSQSPWRLLNVKLNWGTMPGYQHRSHE